MQPDHPRLDWSLDKHIRKSAGSWHETMPRQEWFYAKPLKFARDMD